MNLCVDETYLRNSCDVFFLLHDFLWKTLSFSLDMILVELRNATVKAHEPL
jgi:hypothetical protein